MRLNIIVLSLLFVASVLAAQSIPGTLAERIDSVFAEFDRPGSPGCALGLYQKGAIVYARGYGLAGIEHNVAIGPETVFDIGSTSKQFTAAALVLLEQQGMLSLDDNMLVFFPEFSQYGKSITVRHLLNHTSGLRDYIGLMVMKGHDIDDVTTPAQALKVLMSQNGTDFAPGSTFRYSNSGYFLASQIVEQVTGQTLREYAAENLFAPLGMDHTAFVDDHTMLIPNRAAAYSPGTDETFVRDVSYWEQNGDGGVFTTVEDLLLWDQNFYKPVVGGTDMIASLLQRGVLENGDTLDYSLGLIHDIRNGTPIVQHGGSWGGYRSELIRVPSEQTSVAVLCNCSVADPSDMADQVLGLVLPGRFPQPEEEEFGSAPAPTEYEAVSFNPDLFEAYIGEYELEVQPGFRLAFENDGDYYTIQATGQTPGEIRPLSDTTFFIVDVEATITFHRETDGSVNRITLHQGGTYVAHRVEPVILSPEQLREYTGRYYSSELDIRYDVKLSDGELTLYHPSFDPAALSPADADQFVGSAWYARAVEFVRGEDDVIEVMSVSGGRIRDLSFEKED